MVSNQSYAPLHGMGAKRGSATCGGEQWSGSGWRQREGDVKEGDVAAWGMASPSIAKLGVSSFPTCWVALQQGCGYSRRIAQVA